MSEQGAALMCPACGESFEPPLGAARCFCPHCGKPVDVERTREAAGARVRKEAAAELGISERTLYRKIKDYGLE